MSRMKELFIACEEICEMCGSKGSDDCRRCTLTIKKDGKKIEIKGDTREIVHVDMLEVTQEEADKMEHDYLERSK